MAVALVAAVWLAAGSSGALTGTPVASPVAASPVAATPLADPPGCEGLATYRVAMLGARHAFLDALAAGDVATDKAAAGYSVQDWEVVARAIQNELTAVTEIAPPTWAQPWHDRLLEQIGAQHQIAQATLSRGKPYADALWGGALRTSERRLADALTSVTQTCGAFGAFAEEWDRLGPPSLG